MSDAVFALYRYIISFVQITLLEVCALYIISDKFGFWIGLLAVSANSIANLHLFALALTGRWTSTWLVFLLEIQVLALLTSWISHNLFYYGSVSFVFTMLSSLTLLLWWPRFSIIFSFMILGLCHLYSALRSALRVVPEQNRTKNKITNNDGRIPYPSKESRHGNIKNDDKNEQELIQEVERLRQHLKNLR